MKKILQKFGYFNDFRHAEDDRIKNNKVKKTKTKNNKKKE